MRRKGTRRISSIVAGNTGGFGGLTRTVPSVGTGMVFLLLATRRGIGFRSGPVHLPGATGLGVGFGGFGCTIVAPKVGGFGRLELDETRSASEGAVSTLGTPKGPRPNRSMIVFGMLAWECQRLSMPWRTGPPNIKSGMRDPP